MAYLRDNWCERPLESENIKRVVDELNSEEGRKSTKAKDQPKPGRKRTVQEYRKFDTTPTITEKKPRGIKTVQNLDQEVQPSASLPSSGSISNGEINDIEKLLTAVFYIVPHQPPVVRTVGVRPVDAEEEKDYFAPEWTISPEEMVECRNMLKHYVDFLSPYAHPCFPLKPHLLLAFIKWVARKKKIKTLFSSGSRGAFSHENG